MLKKILEARQKFEAELKKTYTVLQKEKRRTLK